MINEDVLDRIEERSLQFLSKFADEFSVNRYTYLDYVLAVGNITGNIYCIRKDQTVIELDGLGEPYKSHCVVVPDSTATDRVAVLKLMIENDEENFLSTANTSLAEDGRWYNFDEEHLMVPDYEEPIAIYDVIADTNDLDFEGDDWAVDSDGVIVTGAIRCTTNDYLYIDQYRSATGQDVNPLYIGSNLGSIIDEDMIQLMESNNHTQYFYTRLSQSVRDLRKRLMFYDPESAYLLNSTMGSGDYTVKYSDEFTKRCNDEYFKGLWNVIKGDDAEGYRILDEIEMGLDSGIILDLTDELDDEFGRRAENTRDEEELLAVVSGAIKYIKKECEDNYCSKVIVPVNLFPVFEYEQSGGFMLLGEHYITTMRRHDRVNYIYLYYPVENFDEYIDYLMERV